METKWYALRTITGKEKKVKQFFEKYNIQTIIPTEKTYHIKNGKKSVRDKNFYPGYILLESDNVEKIKGLIKNLPEALEVLGVLKPEEVDNIIKNEKISKDVDEPFIVGETVKIIDGPFNSFNGVIDEINESKKRLKVIVNIFERKTPVELDFIQIDKNK